MRKSRQTEDTPLILRTGDFESLPEELAAAHSGSAWLPWTMFMMLLTSVTVGGLVFGLPLHDELTHRRSEASRLQAEAKEAQALAESMQVERDTLSAEKGRLTAELAKKAQALEVALAEAKRVQDELTAKLQAEIKKGEILVHEVNGQLIVDVSDQVLFDSGKADVSPRGKSVLQRLGETFVKLDGKVLQVGGHTDAAPISGKLTKTFATNWELSAARATNVVRFMQETMKIPGERLIAAGFAAYRPVASNSSARGRGKNRRIEIALLPLPDNHEHD